MAHEELLIDADGHILEPPNLFEQYLEPRYRERATRISVGNDGFEFLEVDGKRAELTSAALLHSLGGMKKLQEMGSRVSDFNAGRRKALWEKAKEKHAAFDSLSTGRREDTYMSGCAPGAMDLKERLEILNAEGMAKSVIYPTLGLLWEAELSIPNSRALIAAHTIDGLPIFAATPADGWCRLLTSHSAIRRKPRASLSGRSRPDAKAHLSRRTRSAVNRTVIRITIRYGR